jgi:monovalent cation:proton antiporter-2 (CPA2) family protein
MHGEGFFIQAFMYLAAAVAAVLMAKRLGMGSVLGYLIAGIIMGPFVLHLIGEEGKDIMNFAEFGVVMMLFLIGLELEPHILWRMRTSILGLGGLQVGITTVVIFVICMIADFPWQAGLAIGMILSFSSTAIVLQSLKEKGLLDTDAGQNAFSVLLLQDIAVIPMLALMPLLSLASPGVGPNAQTDAWTANLSGWAYTGVVAGAVAGIVLAGGFLIRPLLRAIAKTRLRELFTAASLLIVISIAILMTKVGLSPALGTFLAGVVLANSEYRHELVGNIEPFKGLLLGLFFIAVGASIDFDYIAGNYPYVIMIVAAMVVLKFAILLILGRIFRMSLDQNFFFSFILAQGGEFAFVLLSFAARQNVLTQDITKSLTVSVAVSMILTPFMILLNEKVFQPRLGTREKSERPADEITGENSVIIAGFGRFGSIVGRLLRAHNVGITVLDHDSDNVDVLRKLGMRVFYGDATRHDLLAAAGADRARLLILAIDDPQRTLEIVKLVKKHYPHLEILARANAGSDAYELMDAGVRHVFRETFETSLCAGRDALRLLGFRAHQVHRAAASFRRHDLAHMEELARSRHERTAYLNKSRQKIEDLEQVLRDEIRAGEAARDMGWDSDAMAGGTSRE